MKTCSDCKIEKEINNENFSFDKSRDRWFSVCKPCAAIRTEKYRQNNKDKWRKSTKLHSIKVKKVIKEWKSKGCSRCDEKRYWVIDAHHVDESTKDFAIGTTMRGIEITKQELEKCIPLCSNCHRDLHYQERKI